MDVGSRGIVLSVERLCFRICKKPVFSQHSFFHCLEIHVTALSIMNLLIFYNDILPFLSFTVFALFNLLSYSNNELRKTPVVGAIPSQNQPCGICTHQEKK